MVDEQLVAYIKQNKAQGYSSQQIATHLVKNGYDSLKVQDAVSFVDNPLKEQTINSVSSSPAKPEIKPVEPEPSSSSHKKIILISIVAILVISIGIALFFVLTKPSVVDEEIILDEVLDTSDGTNSDTVALVDSPVTCVGDNCLFDCGTEMIDCGSSDLMNDCFIDAAKACCSAKLLVESDVSFFGMMMIHSENYMEIRGLEDERCLLFKRVDDNYAYFSSETRQELLYDGATEAEIDQEVLEMNEDSKNIIGKGGTCKYLVDDLVFLLEEEKKGSFRFSTEDNEKNSCTGSLYG